MKLVISIIFLFLQILFTFEGSDLYTNWSYVMYGCVLVTLYHDDVYNWIKTKTNK